RNLGIQGSVRPRNKSLTGDSWNKSVAGDAWNKSLTGDTCTNGKTPNGGFPNSCVDFINSNSLEIKRFNKMPAK
ncbi:hypothetical protein BgiBS90_018348, partial [Biomphalaria glabrata]